MGMKKKDKIKELEKIIEDQRLIINDLKEQLKNQPYIPYYPQPIKDDWTYPKPPFIPECEHDYPDVWHGTVPPHCKKCGKQAPMLDISYDTGIPPWDFRKHGGNVMYSPNNIDLVNTDEYFLHYNDRSANHPLDFDYSEINSVTQSIN